ncbi:hypothetical protein IQ13_2890 [Lacibacter cauensis]|uniref:Uncharacterized protein n=2 Tax=Lacibacter cauensis TaxID=510947 RepID=A0A562SG59_9BACT|nr:hypothetical protein IQ13_2890 [Lacibacter cauensis]
MGIVCENGCAVKKGLCRCIFSKGSTKDTQLHLPAAEGKSFQLSYICSMADDILHNWEKKAAEHQKEYGRFLKRADKNKVLKQLPDLHEEAFEKVDCLQCANCCKNYSPRFKTPDIKRISKHLRMKESAFIDAYLRLDEEGDYVVNTKPCPFLGADNYCSIYEERPSDCERFPYTDEDVILKRPHLTLKNSTFCPATYYVLEKLLAVK